MNITVKDVARDSGLSLSTVIHILGGRHHNYRPATRARVHEVAKRLGYRLNSSARAVRSGRFDCVSLLMSTEQGRTLLRQAELEGMCDALLRHGMHLTVERLSLDAMVDDASLPKMLRERTSDGLVVAVAEGIPRRLVELIENKGHPCVWIRSARVTDCVDWDARRTAIQAVDQLALLGHRRIASINLYQGKETLATAHHSVREILQGYRMGMQKCGLPPMDIMAARPIRCHSGLRIDYCRHLLSQPDRPTALIGSVQSLAPAITAAFLLGLKIPDDLSLIVSAHEIDHVTGLDLTTMLTPEYEIGYKAAEMVMQRIRDPGKPLRRCLLMSHLHPGETCAPPPCV